MTQSKNSSDSPRSEYLPWIDGLRAIAVVAVIIYHLRETWLPGGFAGVDVFFVISGFVVSVSVSRWNRGGLHKFLAYFYARRLQRIAPALLVCLTATSLASTLLIPTAWLSSSIDRTGLFAFFGLSNYFLATQRESYFAPTADFNPFVHTWSLGVEEQFYLLFPLLFFAWTCGARWRIFSAAMISLALVASLANAWFLSSSDPTAAFYLITTRLWELAAGVLLFQCLQWLDFSARTMPGLGWLSKLGAWVALALLAWSLWTSNARAFPYPQAILPIVATLGLLGFLYRAGPRMVLSRMLGSTAMIYVGKRSYSLYLWHWPIFVLLRWTTGLDSVATMTTAVAVTFLISDLSYRYVECPLRYSARLRRSPRIAVVLAGIIVIGSAAALSAAMINAKPRLSLSTVMRHSDEWFPGLLPALDDMPACTLQARNEGAGPTLASIYTRAGCPDQPTLAPDLFALGDSHAIAYSTMLTEYVLRTGAQVTLYPNVGCTFASLQPGREGGQCPAQGDAIVHDIGARAKAGDILFLAAMRLNRLSDQNVILNPSATWDSMAGDAALQTRRIGAANAEAALRPLVNNGLRIILEAPKPMFRAPAFRCSDGFNAGNPICRSGLSESRAALEAYRAPVMQSLDLLAGALNAKIWDPFPLLCPDDPCTAARNGHPLFFDGDHPSAYANRLLYPSFSDFIRAGTPASD